MQDAERQAGPRSTLRVVLWQMVPGELPSVVARREVAALRPDLVVLPEYFAVPAAARMPRVTFIEFDRSLDWLRGLAVELNTVVVGGSVVEKEGNDYFNTCFVYDRRITAGFYRKVTLTERERGAGMSAGSGYRMLVVDGIRLGLLVCADVLEPGAFDEMADLGADVIAIPTSSPFLPDDTAEKKEARDSSIFVAGAHRARAFVLKACSAGSLVGHPLQGRSLIAAPWGVLARVPLDGEGAPQRLVYDLSLDELRRFRDGAA